MDASEGSGGDGTTLLERARDGSGDALETLFARVGPRLLGLIRLRMGPRLRARLESRDVLQTTLLKAFERLDQLAGRDRAALMAWLARIAENEIRDQAAFHGRARREMAREVPLASDPGLVASVRSAASALILDQRLRRLERVLETLPETQREVILLRRFEELSWADVGRRLGVGGDAARMRYARAMAALTLGFADDR